MRTPDPWVPPGTPFSLAQVAPAGITRRKLSTARTSERITRIRHGVYIRSDALPDDAIALHLVRALAEQVAAVGLVASHETAALAHGLPLPSPRRAAEGPVHLTRARGPGQRSQRDSGRRIYVAELPHQHLVRLPSGLLTTSEARTAIDVAVQWELPEALMIIDAALRREFLELAGSAGRHQYGNARLVSAATRPLLHAATAIRAPGRARHLRAVLDHADVRHESPLESFSCAQIRLAGLPAPDHQARIRTPQGDVFPDDVWEEYKVIGEADGEGKYADASAFAREKEREGALRDLDYLVVRWTGREAFGTPAVVTERVARALASRGWQG